jgi:acetate kinase
MDGDNVPVPRQQVCQEFGWFGINIDPDANHCRSACLSLEGKVPPMWVIPTDEEDVIASHTLAVVPGLSTRTTASETSSR